jgi:hypothetical protein
MAEAGTAPAAVRARPVMSVTRVLASTSFSRVRADFPRTAELAKALYDRRTGESVDGVFATDPVALSYLLHGGGPLVVDGERLHAGEVVDQLLNGGYLENPTRAAQDGSSVTRPRRSSTG